MTKLNRIERPDVFLKESGLLFKINREILHPLGMAMVLPRDDDQDIGEMHIIQTDDEEGFLFEDVVFNKGIAKLQNFYNFKGTERIEKRTEKLGYEIQGVETLSQPNIARLYYRMNVAGAMVYDVPYKWAEKTTVSLLHKSLDDHMESSTPEEDERMYHEALEKGVILDEYAFIGNDH